MRRPIDEKKPHSSSMFTNKQRFSKVVRGTENWRVVAWARGGCRMRAYVVYVSFPPMLLLILPAAYPFRLVLEPCCG